MTLKSKTKFGPQPIREEVWRAGYTHSEFADLTGISPSVHVRLAMNGKCPPKMELRRIAPQLLGLPLERLFTAEALAAVYIPEAAKWAPPGRCPMSALDDLSPVARHALWVSCMDSNVPVQVQDSATVERVSALLRPVAPADTKGRTSAARPPVHPTNFDTVPGALAEAPNGSPPNGAPL